MSGDEVIVEVAVNGAVTKTQNPHVPRSPAEIAADALACLEAGAAIIHNHNDDFIFNGDGRHAAAPYEEAWTLIRGVHPEALLYATMASGGAHTQIERRYEHVVSLARSGLTRLGLVDPGSVNLAPAGPDSLPLPLDSTYVNTPKDVRYMFEMCGQLQLAPSISIFDPSFLRLALVFLEAGKVPPGAMVKLFFCADGYLNFGLPPTAKALDAYLELLDGSGLPWSVALLGGDVVESGLAHLALERGGHVRVGIEDYQGRRTPTNLELLEEALRAVEAVGRSTADLATANRMLGISSTSPCPEQSPRRVASR